MLQRRQDVRLKKTPAMLAQQKQRPRRSLYEQKLLPAAPHGCSADSAAAAIPADVGASVSVGRKARCWSWSWSWSWRGAMNVGHRTWADRKRCAALGCLDLDYVKDSRWAAVAGRESQ